MTDNPLHVAYISGCEIVRIEITPGICPAHLSVEDGLRTFHIHEAVSNLHEFIQTHYYHEKYEQLWSRPAKPNKVSHWDAANEEWTWLHEDLLATVRLARDPRLAACDWTQVPDNQLTDEQRNDWREYRQALRDITDNCEGITNVADVVWPTQP